LAKIGKKMKFSEVMAVYDYKLVNVARALNISRETVNQWKKNDDIPFKMQCVLEVVTNGKVKASKGKCE
jgi:uncharacterized protein YjcR